MASEDQKQSRLSAVNINYAVAQFRGKLGDKMLTYTQMPGKEWQLSASLYKLLMPICRIPPVWELLFHKQVWMRSLASYSFTAVRPPLHLASIFRRGGFCISFDESKTLQQSGGIIMGATSHAVAGSYSPRCVATADRMELNPVWALRVEAVTMRNFYGGLSDITAAHHEVCPQQSFQHSINYQRSVRVARIVRELQNIQCRNVLNNWAHVLPFCVSTGSVVLVGTDITACLVRTFWVGKTFFAKCKLWHVIHVLSLFWLPGNFTVTTWLRSLCPGKK